MKKSLTGLTVPQEYVCLDLSKLQDPLSVLVTSEIHDLVTDVTHSHLFLGYHPLIIGIAPGGDNPLQHQLLQEPAIHLDFFQKKSGSNPVADRSSGERVAALDLRKVRQIELVGTILFIYEGVRGDHRFIGRFHQWIALMREKLRSDQGGNVKLDGNLYDQVRIAYAVPRIISLISVADGELMNLFPTDLHGPVGTKYYAGSLRIKGLACLQVETLKNITISEVDPTAFRDAYGLGKNHMKGLRPHNEFALHAEKSRRFHLPLPAAVTKYRELRQIDFFDYGIHRILLYEVVHEERIKGGDPTLAHVHQHYAQWREDRGLKNSFLLR